MRDKNTGKMDLQRFRVAILVTDRFEQVELEEPRKAVGEFSHGAGGGNRTHGLGIMRTVPYSVRF